MTDRKKPRYPAWWVYGANLVLLIFCGWAWLHSAGGAWLSIGSVALFGLLPALCVLSAVRKWQSTRSQDG